MCDINLQNFQVAIEEITKGYLFEISSLSKHNHFNRSEKTDERAEYYNSSGFALLVENRANAYVVNEENFLEGCTRVFLINPLIEKLFDLAGIENDWRFGTTFSSDINLSNRDYEVGAYVEFIFRYQGKNIGCRYTKCSYSSAESAVMERDTAYQLYHKPIPGFDKLKSTDEVWAIDWSGISDAALEAIHPHIEGMKSFTKNISVASFFRMLFSDEVYKLFLDKTKKAIKQAQEIIALKAVPQLLPNNMLSFKETILNVFTKEAVDAFCYRFKGGNNSTLPEADAEIINKNFFEKGLRDAVIGKSDFAKSFITAEYLYQTTSKGLGIDYTSVVVGYLKSVEQLMYILYLSAFKGQKRLQYWDTCTKNKDKFNPALNQYRYDPYDPDQQRMQEFYFHRIRTGNKALEFGGLALFLRHYDALWAISEAGKEYVYACLDDYRSYCRNSYFHKDNISCLDYKTVESIRNNTCVCLYYLLGAFLFLDKRTSEKDQLGTEDYSLERFHQYVWQKRRKCFWLKIENEYEGIAYVKKLGDPGSYNETGRIQNASIHLVKLPWDKNETLILPEVKALVEDDSFVAENSIVLTRTSQIIDFAPIVIRKKR